MTDDKNSSTKFGLGVLLGTVIGGLTAFFLSPSAGPENREMVTKKFKKVMKWLEEADIPSHIIEIYGEVNDEGMKLYKATRKDLAKRMKKVEKLLNEFDAEKYKAMVEESVDAVKTEADETAKRADKLKKYLLKKWTEALS